MDQKAKDVSGVCAIYSETTVCVSGFKPCKCVVCPSNPYAEEYSMMERSKKPRTKGNRLGHP